MTGTRERAVISPAPRISATAMVYGLDICENLRRLSKNVRHAEILLYWTPQENNFPDKAQAQKILQLADELDLCLSVHLPPMLDLVAGKTTACRQNLEILLRLLDSIAMWRAPACVLHAGPHPPTLCANPADYIHVTHKHDLSQWHDNVFAVLARIHAAGAMGSRLLLENLDFSPLLLKPFAEQGLAGICLDIGHLWLGDEDPAAAFKDCAPYIGEMHLHGVCNGREHLSLTATPAARLNDLRILLNAANFAGILNLEVFSEADFEASLNWLDEALAG